MTAPAGFFTGAGLSHAAPAALPLARTFHRRLDEVFYAAAAAFAPELVDHGACKAVHKGPWNVLSRLENTLPGSGAGALACLQIAVPNEEHLLAAMHLAHGGLHITVNVDEGIEQAYALLSGAMPLPHQAPAAYHAALPGWRNCFPADAPALRVVSTPADFSSASFTARPLLVKLHGSVGGGRDGVVLAMPPVADDVDMTELGRHRTAALDALAHEAFVVVTGYSGGDFASCTALVARLRPGRFSWVAPMVRADVRSALRAIDPGQPVTGRAVAAIRARLPVTPPAWPAQRLDGSSFEERFAAWSLALPPRAAAEAFAWALADAGWGQEAVVLLERLCEHCNDVRIRVRLAEALAHRGRPGDVAQSARTFLRAAAQSTEPRLRTYALTQWAACRLGQLEQSAGKSRLRAVAHVAAATAAVTAMGRREGSSNHVSATSAAVRILLSRLERGLAAGMRSSSTRLVLRTLAEATVAEVSRVLAATAHVPSGKHRAQLQRQAVELYAIVALLDGRQPPVHSLRTLRHLYHTYRHLADPHGLADVIATHALVLLGAGQSSRALPFFQEASRLHPASVGVLAAVRDLLDLSSQPSNLADRSTDRAKGSAYGRSRLPAASDR